MPFILAVLLLAPPFPAAETAPKTHAVPPPEAHIDVNRASADELMKVPGMTRTWAARIVRFRPYRSKLDLLDQGVVPGPVYDRVKDFLIAHREVTPREAANKRKPR